jgi:hypothetical protein
MPPDVKKAKNVCLGSNVKIATNSCNQPDGTHIVVNVNWTDPNPGLRVRGTPGMDGEMLGILPVNTIEVFVGSCVRKGVLIWCQVKCKGQNLEGWSNINYLAPVSSRRKDVVGVQDAGIGGGLPVLNGPSSTCSRTGFLPPDGKELISHQCQPDEAANWWCLVTYKATSGWVIREHLK